MARGPKERARQGLVFRQGLLAGALLELQDQQEPPVRAQEPPGWVSLQGPLVLGTPVRLARQVFRALLPGQPEPREFPE
jgi:hypothetical protein